MYYVVMVGFEMLALNIDQRFSHILYNDNVI